MTTGHGLSPSTGFVVTPDELRALAEHHAHGSPWSWQRCRRAAYAPEAAQWARRVRLMAGTRESLAVWYRHRRGPGKGRARE